MRVLILGIDGYLGWPLALRLADRGHVVGGVDNFSRRDRVAEVGGHSATPIARMTDRGAVFAAAFKQGLQFFRGDMRNHSFVVNTLRAFRPDCVVHLAEMPSAPYSMIDAEHAVDTHDNNVNGTLNLLFALRDHAPECHVLKLGTMGEYGTPNVDIPEGEFELEHRGRKSTVQFPRDPGSFYHCTKVHDSVNVRLACKLWGLRSTDIMQGVVYGATTPEIEAVVDIADREAMQPGTAYTRFDFDSVFGTAINRFVAQAIIGHPITLFGDGHQKRGFLPLQDSMQCLTLAVERPPEHGEYRVLNQFEEVYDLTDLADAVVAAGGGARVFNYTNPRKEAEDHYYNPDHQKLIDLGYKPTSDMGTELDRMFGVLNRFKNRIKQREHLLIPDIRWDGRREPVGVL